MNLKKKKRNSIHFWRLSSFWCAMSSNFLLYCRIFRCERVCTHLFHFACVHTCSVLRVFTLAPFLRKWMRTCAHFKLLMSTFESAQALALMWASTFSAICAHTYARTYFTVRSHLKVRMYFTVRTFFSMLTFFYSAQVIYCARLILLCAHILLYAHIWKCEHILLCAHNLLCTLLLLHVDEFDAFSHSSEREKSSS